MICLEWTYIFPSRVANSSPVSDLDPASTAHRPAILDKGALEPRYHARGIRLGVMLPVNIVVGERRVEWGLACGGCNPFRIPRGPCGFRLSPTRHFPPPQP